MSRIDVIVATYGRQAALERCVAALAAQTRLPDRLIVVDDCSAPPARLCTDQVGPLNVELLRTERNSGPARARNLGVERSEAEVVLFVDDDVVADRRLVERHLAVHSSASGPTAVIGPLAAPADWRPTPWNRWEAETLASQYRRMERGDWAPSWRQFYTGNASLRREDFVAAGGFDERFTRAEDVELGLRLSLRGCSFAFARDAIGWHYAERSRASWSRIAGDYARFDVLIDRDYPELGWLAVTGEELSDRHPLLRQACAVAEALRLESFVAESAITLASSASAARLHGASRGLLSLAFATRYRAARRQCLATEASVAGRRSPRPAG